MTAAPKTVVFDFDHTLYDGDSGQHFVTWLLRRSLWRRLLALLFAPLCLPLIACLPTRRRGISGFVWVGTVGTMGTKRDGLTPLLEQYLAEHAEHLRKRLLPLALNVLQRHLDAGDQVIIATGAPPALARGIMTLAGYDALPLFGTEVQACLGGLSLTRHCHFEEKMRILHEAGYAGIDIAYSDSTADLPLLKAAKHPVVVNPKPARIAMFQRVLPEGTPFLNWGCTQRGGLSPEAASTISASH